MNRPDTISLGVCYYPEHWPEEMWEQDLTRMLENGLTCVRIGEFAWSLVEREEGVFDTSFFDRFLSLCEKKGMRVILCTPTATPPAWLTEAHPQTLNCDREGHPYYHGLRCHCTFSSPIYRAYCRRITEVFAKNWAAHPMVIGWQIHNEMNCELNEYYAPSDDEAFRLWCQNRYGNIEALNRAWGTVFWNQTYNDFTQVHLPRKTANGTLNPHLHLDYLRFISDTVCDFANEQAEILKKYIKPGDVITTNGIFGHVDYRKMMCESLDLLTYDSYPNFAYCLKDWNADPSGLRDREWSRALTETRAFSPRFGIMEQQSAANGWTTRLEGPTPRPGQVRLWTLQSIAHGADYVSYFRWRTCRFGTEMYWHGILDHSSRDNRRLREIGQIAELVKKLQGAAGARYAAKVGILRDMDDIFAAEGDQWQKRLEDQSQPALFRAMQKSHTPFDYVYLDETVEDAEQLRSLCAYSVLFAPHLCILTEKRMRILTAYVQAGGQLIFGARTGCKTIDGQHHSMNLPGLAAVLCGIDIPEYSFVPPDEEPALLSWLNMLIPAPVFREEIMVLPGTGSIAVYHNGSAAGVTALSCRKLQKGRVWYLGCAFSEEMVVKLLQVTGTLSPFEKQVSLPADCELAVRKKQDKQYFFLLNYMKEERTVTLHEPFCDLESGETMQGTVTLPPYGVMVLVRTC